MSKQADGWGSELPERQREYADMLALLERYLDTAGDGITTDGRCLADLDGDARALLARIKGE